MQKIKILILSLVLVGLQQSFGASKDAAITQSTTQTSKDYSGCSCYFYKTRADMSRKDYFMVNDFSGLAYVKYNKDLMKLKLIEASQPGASEKYYLYKAKTFTLKLVIEKDDNQNAENHKLYGKITITFDNGKVVKSDFIGECGC